MQRRECPTSAIEGLSEVRVVVRYVYVGSRLATDFLRFHTPHFYRKMAAAFPLDLTLRVAMQGETFFCLGWSSFAWVLNGTLLLGLELFCLPKAGVESGGRGEAGGGRRGEGGRRRAAAVAG